MELCYKLWDSWEPDAIVANHDSGVFADPTKVHEVNHVGEFFRSRGRSFVCARRRAARCVAGGLVGPWARRFAAKHAEAIFAVHPNVERMRAYADDLNARLPKPGSRASRVGQGLWREFRRSSACRAARRRKNTNAFAMHPAGRRDRVVPVTSALTSPKKYDPDEIVQNIEIPEFRASLTDHLCQGRRAGDRAGAEEALIYAEGMGMPRLVGTAADIADQLEYFLDEAKPTASCWPRPIRPAASRSSSIWWCRNCNGAADIGRAIPARPCARTCSPIETLADGAKRRRRADLRDEVHAVNAVAKPIAPCSTRLR